MITDPIDASDFFTFYSFNQLPGIKGAITRPNPIPIKMEATNNRAMS